VLGLVSDETIAKRTGRPWAEWFALLDRWGASERSHSEIARHVNAEHGVPGWWSQTITVGYERASGRRAVHESSDGFSVTVSNTIAVPVERLFERVCDPGWPAEGALRMRTSQPARSARFDWEDGTTRVQAYFYAKGDSKSTVHIQHERLADADAAEQAKLSWRERLSELKRALEEVGS
jgi:hypothetical protein